MKASSSPRRRSIRIASAIGLLVALGACADLGGLAGGEENDTPRVPDRAADVPAGDGGPRPDEQTGCAAGSASCGGACVDVSNDPKNCGRCGRDCLGAACSAGACAPIVLAEDVDIPQGLAVDAEHVYVTLYGESRVIRVPKRGGPTELVSASTSSPWGIAVDRDTSGKAKTVVWGEARSGPNLNVCASASCTEPSKIALADEIRHVTVGAGVAYFTQPSSGTVSKCGLPACENVDTLVSGEMGAWGVAVKDAVLVVGRRQTSGSVRRITTAGNGLVDLVTPLDNPEGLATDGQNVFVAVNSGSAIAKCPLLGCSGPPTFAFATYAHGVATDGANVYWTNGLAKGGSVEWCPTSGCSGDPRTLAPGQSNAADIVVDDEAVYWTNSVPKGSGGSVMKIAKP